MASEYLKWKYKDVRPDIPKELTPAEKRSNWWHYHKWYAAAAAYVRRKASPPGGPFFRENAHVYVIADQLKKSQAFFERATPTAHRAHSDRL